MQTPSADAKKWGKNQFSRLFPSLQEAQFQPTPLAPDIAKLLARLIPIQAGILATRRTDGEVKRAEETPVAYDCFVISTPELKYLLQLCGKPSGGTFDSLPTWFQKC